MAQFAGALVDAASMLRSSSTTTTRILALSLALIATGVVGQSLSPPITSRFKCLTNGCCDQHEWCRFWASIGECSMNSDWMNMNCQLACGTCRAGPATTSSTSSSSATTSSFSSSSSFSTNQMESTRLARLRMRNRQRQQQESARRRHQQTPPPAPPPPPPTTPPRSPPPQDRFSRPRMQQQFGMSGGSRLIITPAPPNNQFAAAQQLQQQQFQRQQQMQLQQQQFQRQQQVQLQLQAQQQQQRFPQQRLPTPMSTVSTSASSVPTSTSFASSTSTGASASATSVQPGVSTTPLGATTSFASPTVSAAAVGASTLPPAFVAPPSVGAVQPVTSCKDVERARAAEVLIASGLVDAVDDTFGRATLSIDDITRAVPTGCVPELRAEGVDCNVNLCFHLMFRSFDGTCNNLKKPMQGSSFRRFNRHFPPQYDDGKGEPASSITQTRPTARESNRIMLSSAQAVFHDKYNNLMMQFGQFISHDIAKTTLQPSAQCQTCTPVPSKCMPIPIGPKDPNMQFKAKECLKVSRSAPLCQVTPREQLNENTAYIDGSMIYGSSPKDLFKFREGRTGMLRLLPFNNQRVLPFDQSKCAKEDGCVASFTAGDIRANLFIGLSSFHILFAREHNRVATEFQRLNPQWSGDRVFHEARKLNGAQIQHIFFTSYLPKLLGNSFEKLVGAYQGYDENADSTIANEFTTGAFRFGHGMIEEFYQRLEATGQNITQGGFFFGDGVFKSGKILWEGGVDPILRGMMMTNVKRPHRMTPAITEKMFGSTDLGSLNIQRGRDHGIPSYNKMRQFCGLPPAKSFEEFGDMILDKNLRIGLSRNYNTPDDVDFYVGAMLEDPVVGGLVGTTLSCVIGEQFKRTRNGDRFYYENPGIFTPRQLEQIRKSSLSKIICNNGDHFELISQDALLVPGPQLTPCTQIPDIDLSAWKE